MHVHQLGRNNLFVDNSRRTRGAVIVSHVLRTHHTALLRGAFSRWRAKFGPRRAHEALIEISTASRQQALSQLTAMRRTYQLSRAFAQWRNFNHQQARAELARARANEFASVDQDREALLALLLEAQKARDSLEEQLRSLKDESANTLAAVLQRLQAIDSQAQRSGRLLIDQRQAHAAELDRMDDALERHRRRGAQGRLRLVLGSQRTRALQRAWQAWRLHTLAHALLLQSPLTQEGHDAGSLSIGQSMSTPSLLGSAGLGSGSASLLPQTPQPQSSGILSPLAQAALMRASSNGLKTNALSVSTTSSADVPFNAEELIPPQVLQAATSPAPVSRVPKATASALANATGEAARR